MSKEHIPTHLSKVYMTGSPTCFSLVYEKGPRGGCKK